MISAAINVQPVILWTDALIFALLFGVLALVWFIRRQEHLLAPSDCSIRCITASGCPTARPTDRNIRSRF